MIDEGHTIGIHGYSHDYSQIYTSNDAFMENINKLKNKLKEDTGYDAYVIRFRVEVPIQSVRSIVWV